MIFECFLCVFTSVSDACFKYFICLVLYVASWMFQMIECCTCDACRKRKGHGPRVGMRNTYMGRRRPSSVGPHLDVPNGDAETDQNRGRMSWHPDASSTRNILTINLSLTGGGGLDTQTNRSLKFIVYKWMASRKGLYIAKRSHHTCTWDAHSKKFIVYIIFTMDLDIAYI
jgi:hypothetical protein